MQPILPDWVDHFRALTVQIGGSSGADVEAAALEVLINHLGLVSARSCRGTAGRAIKANT